MVHGRPPFFRDPEGNGPEFKADSNTDAGVLDTTCAEYIENTDLFKILFSYSIVIVIIVVSIVSFFPGNHSSCLYRPSREISKTCFFGK